jgi:hypothetical protein
MPSYDVAPELTVITQGYGCTPFPEYWDSRCPQYFHCGIDLGSANAWDRPQFATRGGRVTHAGNGAVPGQPGLGIGVVIRLDDGNDMLYGHFARLAVSVGQRVEPRQVIGFTGSTGYSTGPHAHIEVRRPGNLVASTQGVIDPGPYLTAQGVGAMGGFLMALSDDDQKILFDRVGLLWEQLCVDPANRSQSRQNAGGLITDTQQWVWDALVSPDKATVLEALKRIEQRLGEDKG